MRGRDRRQARRTLLSANERFHRAYASFTWIGIVIATAFHFGLFELNPAFGLGTIEGPEKEIEVFNLPPEVRIPPPPEAIARPARPRLSSEPVAEEMTIAPTTFEANPVENLPPPPVATGQRKAHTPFYVPREVDPRLLNGSRIARLLKERYPPPLREAGIEGTVVLWLYVDEQGRVTDSAIHSSSGYAMLDRVALEAISEMRFSPALHMDRPVAVWIAQPVHFRIQ